MIKNVIETCKKIMYIENIHGEREIQREREE